MTDDNAFNEKNSFNSECKVQRLCRVSSSSSSSSSYLAHTLHSALVKFLLRRREPHSEVLNFTQIENIVRISFENKEKLLHTEKIYSVGHAGIPKASERFTVIDDECVISHGLHEFIIKKVEKDKFEQSPPYGYDKWKDSVSGELVKRIDIYDTEKIMKSLKRAGFCFADVVNFVLDDTGTKDKRIVDMVKASILPIPMSQRERLQPFNCHSFVLTNTGVAKSTTFLRILGFEPATDFSEAGLLGGFTSSEKVGKKIIEGSLNGDGVQVFDEFPEKDHPIMHKLLSYTENGETSREMVEKIICKGTKSLVFLGNASEDSPDAGFIKNVIGLSTGKTLSRIGRRFSIILYGNDFSTVKASDVNVSAVKIGRNIIHTAFRQHEDLILRALNYGMKWVLIEDDEYAKYFNGLSHIINYGDLREFLSGHAMTSKRIKFASLKCAIINNFSDIVLSCGHKDILRNVVNDAKEQYENFCDYNKQSFNFVKECPKAIAHKMMRRGNDMKTICSELGISRRTYFIYKKDFADNNGDGKDDYVKGS